MSEITTRPEEDTVALLADLERELGVTGTAAVFKKALVIAKETAAAAQTRQDAFAANDLAYRLRCWGENDPDPEFFTGELLHGVLLDCGAGSEAILAAESRAASAEAEVERLKAELKEARDGWDRWKGLHAGGNTVIRQLEASASALRDRVAVLESALKKIRDNAEYGRDTYAADVSKTGQSLSRCWGIVRDYADVVLSPARAALNGGDHE